MRTDQYIGLTADGEKFIQNLLKTEKIISNENIFLCNQAFNPDPLFGFKITTENNIFQEKLQCAPWSSGPVYLTRIDKQDKNGKHLRYLYSWKEDENVTGEVDQIKGTYYI